MNRRLFLKTGISSTIGLAMSEFPFSVAKAMDTEFRFKIFLAQWSLNKGFSGPGQYAVGKIDLV